MTRNRGQAPILQLPTFGPTLGLRTGCSLSESESDWDLRPVLLRLLSWFFEWASPLTHSTLWLRQFACASAGVGLLNKEAMIKEKGGVQAATQPPRTPNMGTVDAEEYHKRYCQVSRLAGCP